MLWDVVSTWKAPTPLFSSYLLSTFSHFANRSNSIQYYLNRKFQTFNCFPHRVIHTLLDGLNIHLLNISKKLIRTCDFVLDPDGILLLSRFYLREHNLYSAQRDQLLIILIFKVPYSLLIVSFLYWLLLPFHDLSIDVERFWNMIISCATASGTYISIRCPQLKPDTFLSNLF
jgi:hypothetical protein